jgi:hypothetical protein
MIKEEISEDLLKNIRLTLNKNKVLGDVVFIEKMEKLIRRPIISKNWGGDRRSQHYQETHRGLKRTKARVYKDLAYKEKRV